MRHLFIINPIAAELRGGAESLLQDIHVFFRNYPQMRYHIHITRWRRDAVGFIKRFVRESDGIVRVYAVGGNGTLFEVINGAAGLPNVQVAFFPYGASNSLVYTFTADKQRHFHSLKSQVFADTGCVDTIRTANNYCVSNILIGAEAEGGMDGEALSIKTRLPRNLCYIAAGALWALKSRTSYHITLDGENVEGSFISICVSNSRTYGLGLIPASRAIMDDGLAEILLIRPVPPRLMPQVIRDYDKGHFDKWPQYILYRRGREITISSEDYMTISMDGEIFFDSSITCSVLPRSLNLALPGGTRLSDMVMP